MQALVNASETMDEQHAASEVLTKQRDTYWCPHEGTEQAWIELDLQEERSFDRVVLMEHIHTGQRIERFTLESQRADGGWEAFYTGTVVGYKRICCFPQVTLRNMRVTIHESRWYPTLSGIGIYLSDRGGMSNGVANV